MNNRVTLRPEKAVNNTQKPAVIINLPATSTAKQVQTTLSRICETYSTPNDNWCLGVNPLGFKNHPSKYDWELSNHDYDVKELHYFTDFIEWNFNGTEHKTGLFITPRSQGFDGTYHENWYAWVAVLRRNIEGGGYLLAIWDPSWEDRTRKRMNAQALPPQRDLIQMVQRKHRNIKTVWIGGSGNVRGGNSLQLAVEYIHQIVRPGRVTDFPAPDGKAREGAGYREVGFNGEVLESG